jgi:ubiquinone/menaquinone biosynthesis C-methylase UbiE
MASSPERMEEWYADFTRDPDEAHRCLSYDYEPLAGRLAALEGEVLDVGGGMDLTRHFLSPEARYTVVDPSSAWLSSRWHDVTRLFPEPVTPARYVRGVGERLPFRTAAIDAVVALWSLNHVSDPVAVRAEIARVTRPGGRLIVVLEDVSADDGPREPVTLQSDHIDVPESDFRAWLVSAFAVVRRDWVRHYVAFDAVREGGARTGPAPTAHPA